MSQPILKYKLAFLLDDGSKPSLTEGKDYEIFSAFLDPAEDVTIISVLDDAEFVFQFDITEEWFSESFDIVGDLDLVWEEI